MTKIVHVVVVGSTDPHCGHALDAGSFHRILNLRTALRAVGEFAMLCYGEGKRHLDAVEALAGVKTQSDVASSTASLVVLPDVSRRHCDPVFGGASVPDNDGENSFPGKDDVVRHAVRALPDQTLLIVDAEFLTHLNPNLAPHTCAYYTVTYTNGEISPQIKFVVAGEDVEHEPIAA